MAMRDYVPVGTPELFRCRKDGALVTDHLIRLGRHAGHHLETPVKLSWVEWITCWLRLIR